MPAIISTFSKTMVYPVALIVPPPSAHEFWPGVYFKVGSDQTLNPGNTWFPAVYNPANAAHNNSVYGILDNKVWCRGFQLEVGWGEVDNGNADTALWNWDWLDTRMSTVAALAKPNGQNKKVLFLIPSKVFYTGDTGSVAPIIPADLMAFTGVPHAIPPDRGITIPPTRYDYLWGFLNGAANGGAGFIATHGYHYNFHHMVNGLSGNDQAGNLVYTFRNRFYKFLDAVINRYKDSPAFAGLVTTEPAPVAPLDSTAFIGGNSVLAYQNGRVEHLKYIKTKLLKHPVAEAANFNRAYVDRMTLGTTNVCVTERVAYSNPNFHTGDNQTALPNINAFLKGKVAVFLQAQPLDMDSRAGGRTISKYNGWTPTPPGYGAVGTIIIKPADFANKATYVPSAAEKPITGLWTIERCKYYGAQYLIYQRDTASTNLQYDLGDPRFNWDNFSSYMDANYATDQYGGMSSIKPEFFV